MCIYDCCCNKIKCKKEGSIRPSLSARASRLFAQITKGRYSTIDLDDDYNIEIEDEGKRFSLERFSGGEVDLANLCLRIAISQEISERSGGKTTEFIVLDEIFCSQDLDRKDSIMNALRELCKQFKQIILITHIEDIKESLPFVLNVTRESDSVRVKSEGIVHSMDLLQV